MGPCPNPKACEQQGLFSPSPTPLPHPHHFPSKGALDLNKQTTKCISVPAARSSPNKADDGVFFSGAEPCQHPFKQPQEPSSPLSHPQIPPSVPKNLLSVPGRSSGAAGRALARRCTDAAAAQLPQAEPSAFPLFILLLLGQPRMPAPCSREVAHQRYEPAADPTTSSYCCRSPAGSLGMGSRGGSRGSPRAGEAAASVAGPGLTYSFVLQTALPGLMLGRS